MEALNKIRVELDDIKKEYENAINASKYQYAHIAALRWYNKTFTKSLASFDKLKSNKLKSQMAGIAEHYMRCLLKLDSVDCADNDEMRALRKETVKEINNTLLPNADLAVKRFEALVQFDHSVQASLLIDAEKNAAPEVSGDDASSTGETIQEEEEEETSSVKDEQDPMEQDQEATPVSDIEQVSENIATEGTQPELEDEDSEKSEPEESCPKADTETLNKRSNAAHKVNDAPSPKKCQAPLRKLRYNVAERPNYAHIRVALPRGINPKLVTIGLNEQGSELTLIVPGFEELVFDVSAHTLIPSKTSYAFDRRTWEVIVDIPKRFVERKPTPHFGYFPQAARQDRRFVPQFSPNMFFNM